jgi:hypothetical protein
VWPAPPWCRLSWPARSGRLVLPLQVRLPICLLSLLRCLLRACSAARPAGPEVGAQSVPCLVGATSRGLCAAAWAQRGGRGHSCS